MTRSAVPVAGGKVVVVVGVDGLDGVEVEPPPQLGASTARIRTMRGKRKKRIGPLPGSSGLCAARSSEDAMTVPNRKGWNSKSHRGKRRPESLSAVTGYVTDYGRGKAPYSSTRYFAR
jgi:hypothetical protein